MNATPVEGAQYVATHFAPSWAVSSGGLIRAEIEATGFSQADVAVRANISAKHLNQLLQGHVPLTPEVAVALERVLGTSSDLWLRMDATWQALKLRQDSEAELDKRADWLRKFPTHVLEAHHIVGSSGPIAARVDALLRFFRVADIKAFEGVWLAPQANYRRSQKFAIDPYATALWLRLAECEAEEKAALAAPYDAHVLRRVVEQIPALSRLPVGAGFRQAAALLASAGVVLVFVPEIEQTRICGVSRWLRSGHAMVAVSGRQKFVDVLWFTLLHELAHVLLHPKRATYLELERKRGGVANDNHDEEEEAADSFAQRALLSPRDASQLRAIRTVEDLHALSQRAGVADGIVAGRYAHETNDWKTFGRVRTSIDLAQALSVG